MMRPAAALVSAARERLTNRYPRDARPSGLSTLKWSRVGFESELSEAISTGDNRREWTHPALGLRDDAPGPLTAEDITDALALSAYATYDRLKAERNLIDMARRRGVSWLRIARALALPDGRAAQRHHQMLVKLVGSDNWYLDAPGQPRGEAS
ncbi:hypothetical protein AB0K34_14235 [Actinomadura sp. NPDC049382]|uniref:hypothetical protein n=1 Tax=Actinomadura sp. NPDC049382 TaxID=3158220 RepID=UPI0034449A89